VTTILEATPLAAVDTGAARPPQVRTTLAVTISDFDGGVLVRIEGDAGIVGLEKLEVAFARVIARRTLLAVLDLSHLTFVSRTCALERIRLVRAWLHYPTSRR
jgi:hypothetical protein